MPTDPFPSLACPSGGRLGAGCGGRVDGWSDGGPGAGVPRHARPGAGQRVRRLACCQDDATTSSSTPIGPRSRRSAPAAAPSAEARSSSTPTTMCGAFRRRTRGRASAPSSTGMGSLPRRAGAIDGAAGQGKEGAAGPRRLPRRGAQALWLRADAHHRARVQAPLCGAGNLAGPHQGAGGPRLCPGDGRRRYGRHAGRHHPITKKGKPISSALGYAQLLHANTIGELVKHGDMFVKRLQRLKAGTGDPARADELHRKIAALQAMIRSARRCPTIGTATSPSRRLEGLRHSRHQPRRRHRPLAAIAEAAGPQGLPPPARA